MLAQVLVILSVIVLLVAVVLFVLTRRDRKVQRLRGIEEERKRQVMRADLGDQVVWSVEASADELGGRDLSRRRFVPNVLAGLAALLLFRLAGRGVNVERLAEKVHPARKRGETSTTSAETPDSLEAKHTDIHHDWPEKHIDVCDDKDCTNHVDTTRPHNDNHQDHDDGGGSRLTT